MVGVSLIEKDAEEDAVLLVACFQCHALNQAFEDDFPLT